MYNLPIKKMGGVFELEFAGDYTSQSFPPHMQPWKTNLLQLSNFINSSSVIKGRFVISTTPTN